MAINFPSTAGQATDGSFTYNVAGIIYAWNGSSWQAAGAGASATDRTLFSVTQNAAGSAALSYNNTNGVFSYTPPDLSSYLTAEADTLATVTGRGASTTTGITLSASNLILDSASDQRIQHNVSGTETSKIIFRSSGAVDYYASNGMSFYASNAASPINRRLTLLPAGGVQVEYQNGVKLETTAGGVTVTGALTAGGLTYPTTNGTSGQVLTSDGGGNVTWTTPSGLQSRTTAQVTQSIANNAAANVSFTTPKTYALLSIQTNVAAWVTLYMDTTSRTNDASRGETTDPVPGSGVLAEAITTGSTTQYITPGAVCFNSAGTGITYAKIVNKSGGTTNVTVTLNYVQLEA